MRFSDIFCGGYKKGFTLPEILLAASIIAIIAAAVVPATISRYQQKTFKAALEKYKIQIQEAVDALPVTENVADFSATSLYVDKNETYYPPSSSEPIDDDDKRAVANFLKNNFKTTKIYVNINGSDDADYIRYATDSLRSSSGTGYHAVMNYFACADLKSGAFLCVRSQTKKEPNIWIYLDVNGSDDKTSSKMVNMPNSYGIDIYEFTLPHKDVATSDVITASPMFRPPEP